MTPRRLPVIGLKRQLSQSTLAGQTVGILLYQPQILTISLTNISARALCLRIAQPRLTMRSIQLEYIAKLDQSTIHVALLQQFQARFIMPFSAFFRCIAKG